MHLLDCLLEKEGISPVIQGVTVAPEAVIVVSGLI
jgi:hypothetical protein